MNTEQDIKDLEIDIDVAKKCIKLYENLENLRKNEDFKALIDQHYFKDEASRLVLLKAAQQMESQESQIRILNQVDAIGHLQQFFMRIEVFGRQAAGAMRDYDETLSELREEGGDV